MSRLCSLAVACITLVNTSGTYSTAQKTRPPLFEDFPVKVWRGRVAPLNLRSHPLARTFRTSLRRHLQEEGVNLAGHCTFATVGCGAGCSINAIVDDRNGTAYFPNELSGWTGIVGDYEISEADEQQTQANGRMLRMLGRPNIGKMNEERHGPSGIYFYEWANNRLGLVKFIHVGSYPDPDPPRHN